MPVSTRSTPRPPALPNGISRTGQAVLALLVLLTAACAPTVRVTYRPESIDRLVRQEATGSVALWRELEADPTSPEAREQYNAAMEAQLLGTGREEIPLSSLEAVDLSALPAAWQERLRGVALANALQIQGMDYRYFREGVGVPLIGRLEMPESESVFFVDGDSLVPITAVLQPDGSRGPVWKLFAPRKTETVAVGGRQLPLAGDFTAPWAAGLSGFNDLLMGLAGLIGLQVVDQRSGIYLTEPYDPDRIPVLMVHGLGSSPLIWRNIANAIKADPELSRRYQVWVVYYRSGAPIVQSAAYLRELFDSVLDRYDPARSHLASRDSVWVGHSMGGVLTHAAAKEINGHLWAELSDRPFGEIRFSESIRDEIRPWVFWEPVPALSRGIFIATPHRGSTLADSSLAQFGKRLIRLPFSVIRLQLSLLENAINDIRLDARTPSSFNSISSLSPSAPIFQALSRSEWKPGFEYHTIVGDQGHPVLEASSDGIVGFWSSGIDGARSQISVPTGHAAFEHPDAVREVLRILREHPAR